MAGTIDSLDFKIILDDKDFNATIQRDLKIARELNTQLTNVLNLKKKLNGETTQQLVNAEKVRQAEQKTAQEIAKTALQQEKVRTQTEKTAAAQRSHTGAVQGTNTALLSTTSIMRTLSMLMGTTFSVIAIRRFLSSLIDITGQFEVQKMALRNMLQDVEAADKIFKDLYNFSSNSTYRFSELAKYAKQLAAFNIDKSNLLETTKMLGDVASGVGVSMDRLILAYGHVKSSGFLRGIQLRSFSQNGVPILDELAKMIGEVEDRTVSLGEVFDKMTKREIPFEMVEEAFRRMTSEGGKFYRMQEVLAQTLAGQINILKGKWENALYAIGKSNDSILKGGVQALRYMVEHLNELGAIIKPIVAGFGAYYSILLLVTLAQKGMALATFVSEFFALSKAVGVASAATLAFGSAAKAAAVGLGLMAAAAFGIYELVKSIKEANTIINAANKATNEFTASVDVEKDKLYDLLQSMRDVGSETKEYKELKDELLANYGTYLDEVDREKIAIGDLTGLYDKLSVAVENAAKQRFLMSGTQDIEDAYVNRIKTISINSSGVYTKIADDAVKQEISDYIFLRKDFEELSEEAKKAIDEHDKVYDAIANRASSRDYLESTTAHQMTIKGFRELAKSAKEERDEAVKIVERTFGSLQPRDGGSNPNIEEIPEWLERVNGAIDKIDSKKLKEDFAPKKDEGYFQYLKRMAEEAKELSEYERLALESEKKQFTDQLDAINLIDTALEGNISKANEKKPRGNTTPKNPFADSISDAKTAISTLEKYRAAYEKLEKWIGADEAKKWVDKNMGYNVDNFEHDVEEIIVDLKKMGDEGNEAADAIEARLGLDKASKAAKEYEELQKKMKAVEKVQKELDKWKKEWGGNYSGFDAELEDVFDKYINENLKIDKEYTDALKEAAIVYKDDEVALKKYTDELERYYKVRKDANFNKSQNDINELASKYVKDATKGMSLSDWGDKSLSQVYTIWKTLDSMADSALDGGMTIDINLVQQVEKAGFSLKDFSKLTYEEFQKLGKEAQEELLKKVGGAIKDIASTCKDAASSVQEFADAAGNMNLSATIEDLSNFVDLASSVAERVARGDIVGAATSMVSWYVKRIFEAKTEAMKLEAALASVREEARRTQMESALSFGTDGIFGKNSLQGVSNSLSLIRDLEKSMGKYASEVSSKRFFGSRLGFFEWASEPNQKFHYTNLQKMAEAVGGDLYDAYGNLNADTLQDILDTYENLDAEQRAWIEHAISDSEAYAKAMEQIDQVAESIVGGLVSDVADKMVDSWWEAGEAALDYADILGDVAKAYAKLIVQDMLMDAAFDEGRQKEFKDALKSGDAAKAMAVVEQAMASAESMLPAVNAALQAFEPYRVAAQDALDSSSNSVGNGIKSITEETANLLASYINAIRADVSYIRLMQEKGWSSVNALGAFVPDLNDYLAQVAATNYDIAQSNQAILAELRTVIGAPGTSGSVVRVERYN